MMPQESLTVALSLEHVELKDANEFVSRLHRHHKPVRGHRFSIGAVRRNVVLRNAPDQAVADSSADAPLGLVGVAICGRPVARAFDHTRRVEVLRLCTDGTKNACSFLYSAAARAARSLGYSIIQTYVLGTETGISLKASGWTRGHAVSGRDWNCPSRSGRRTDQPMDDKVFWFKSLDGSPSISAARSRNET